ncbi:MAG: hypothetical protein DRO99_00590 [Candidatus Aenigmatarchaeota archaeon]|nr:MAG: hypothetical protein DRO99_00590 [Candidatus Aenigmarchaeota archaeon]
MHERHFPFILPAITLIAAAFFLAGPGITGMVTAPTGVGEVTAKIRISTSPDKVIPAGSVIIVTLNDSSKSMPIEEFINLSGEPSERRDGKLPSIKYYGEGYTGTHNYTVDISDLGIRTRLPAGDYVLRTEVVYGSSVITSIQRPVSVNP